MKKHPQFGVESWGDSEGVRIEIWDAYLYVLNPNLFERLVLGRTLASKVKAAVESFASRREARTRASAIAEQAAYSAVRKVLQ